MSNHVRMAIYSIKQGTYHEHMERAREGMAPILRESPGFVFYSTTDVGGGRFVSVSTWEGREQAEAATEKVQLSGSARISPTRSPLEGEPHWRDDHPRCDGTAPPCDGGV